MHEECTNAMRKYLGERGCRKSFEILGLSVSVTTVTLYLSVFRPTHLASQPAKRERDDWLLAFSLGGPICWAEFQTHFFLTTLSAKKSAKRVVQIRKPTTLAKPGSRMA